MAAPMPSTSPSAARRGSVPGLEDVPLAYGSPRDELAALETAGVADLGTHGLLEVRGADAASFLQDVLAGPLGSAEPGEAVPTLLLTTDGKVEAVAVAWLRDDEAVDLLVQAPHGEAAAASLEEYARFVDATVEAEAEADLLHVAGEEARDLLAEHGPVPEEGAVVAGDEIAVAGHGLGTGPGYTLRAPSEAGLRETLVEGARERGGGPVGWRALEARRIRTGVPRAGAEVTPERFPPEAGLEPGVDLGKGCFVGQETVARIANRGQVNWQVVQLTSGEPLRAGEPLRSAGEVGEVTSGTDLTGPPRALGLVRREVAEEGSRLASSSGPADVVGAVDWGRELGL
jgi:folate-binding protein YgfZ